MENTAFEGLNIKEEENITKILDLKLNILVLPSLSHHNPSHPMLSVTRLKLCCVSGASTDQSSRH